jgi:hypothetical protein
MSRGRYRASKEQKAYMINKLGYTEMLPVVEGCHGVPNEDDTKNIPPCSDIMEDGTCRRYPDPSLRWKNGQVCPCSNQSSVNYIKPFLVGRKINPLKQSKRNASGKR